MKNLIRDLVKSESGATAVEYSLLAAMISLAIISVLQLMGPELVRVFTIIVDTLVTVAV